MGRGEATGVTKRSHTRRRPLNQPIKGKGVSVMTTEQKIIKNKVGLLEFSRFFPKNSRYPDCLDYLRWLRYLLQILKR